MSEPQKSNTSLLTTQITKQETHKLGDEEYVRKAGEDPSA